MTHPEVPATRQSAGVFSGCGDKNVPQQGLTGVRLTVTYDAPPELDQLRISGTADSTDLFTDVERPEDSAGPLSPDGEDVVFLFPDSQAGHAPKFLGRGF